MFYFILTLFIQYCSSNTVIDTSQSISFENFYTKYKRSYKGIEYQVRKDIYTKNVQVIDKHNQSPSLYRMGVNDFTDKTDKELLYLKGGQTHHEVSIQTIHLKGTNQTALPDVLDYRTHQPAIINPVRDQGNCGSCWAFSTVETIASQYAFKYGPLYLLSPQQLISCDHTSISCVRGNPSTAFVYLSGTSGVYQESVYPYQESNHMPSPKNISACRSPNTLPGSPKVQVTASIRVPDNSPLETQLALTMKGPISACGATNGWNAYVGGIFDYPLEKSGDVNHCFQLVGYGFDTSLKEKYWIVRNTWGTGWGEDGYIRLKRYDNPPCIIKNGAKLCGTSQMLAYVGYPHVAPV